jgi:molybdate transport system substrate-binding protein
MSLYFRIAGALAILLLAPLLSAQTVQVAVAANFSAPMKQIAESFEKDTGHKVLLSSGATGKFYAQIKSGAPFDVFLSADDETPARLDAEGATVAGSRFTYATGRLVLWSPRAGVVDSRGDVLRANAFRNIAIAAPKLAPYGAAAVQTLERLGLLAAIEPKFVQGESIGQTFNFVSSGNAELGFIALSQVFENGQLKSGSGWVVPAPLHSPLRQDAVQLVRSKDNPAAAALMRYLKSERVRAMIRAYGYEV